MSKEHHGFGFNFEAYFLGPKGENLAFYERLLKETLEDHVAWRTLRPFKGLGFSKKEWLRVKKVKVLRSVIMSPYLTPDYVDENYVGLFLDYLQEEISLHPGFLASL